MAENACPPLGTGSVDLNALHDAAKSGDEITEATIEDVTTGGPPLAEPPSLNDKKLDELREIAEAEGVDVSGLRKKAEVTAAIEDHREAAAPPPPVTEIDPAPDAADRP